MLAPESLGGCFFRYEVTGWQAWLDEQGRPLGRGTILNETLQTNVTVYRNVAGPVNQVHWVSARDSFASGEEIAA